jgi:flagellar biosynthesis GTPase FlhF
VSNPIDKLTEIAGAAANPLSAAESTLKAARGVVNQGHGLVEDVRKIAEAEAKRAEKKSDQKAIQSAIDKHRAAKRVGKRESDRAAENYNADTQTVHSAAEKILIEKKAQEEEHALIWSMSADERAAYLQEKRKQIELRRKEERRIELERIRRKELRDGIIGGILALMGACVGMYFIFDWLSIEATGQSIKERMGK